MADEAEWPPGHQLPMGCIAREVPTQPCVGPGLPNCPEDAQRDANALQQRSLEYRHKMPMGIVEHDKYDRGVEERSQSYQRRVIREAEGFVRHLLATEG